MHDFWADLNDLRGVLDRKSAAELNRIINATIDDYNADHRKKIPHLQIAKCGRPSKQQRDTTE